MMDWTDRHCRFFHRLLTRHTLLYTEMVTTGALRHGSVQRHLRFNAEEHPVALQLGGSEPADLARCARLATEWGYDEINLNCGCPSERVQRGSFGACLMAEPALVADGVKAMLDVVSVPVTFRLPLIVAFAPLTEIAARSWFNVVVCPATVDSNASKRPLWSVMKPDKAVSAPSRSANALFTEVTNEL
jgi:hypothetical protein